MQSQGMVGSITHWFLITMFTVLGCEVMGVEAAENERSDVRADTDVIASWNGGHLTMIEIEARVASVFTPACRDIDRGAADGKASSPIVCFREVAERMALEDLVRTELGGRRTVDGSGEDHERALLRRAYATTWTRWNAEEIDRQITGSDIVVYYEMNRERYRQPDSVELWNIFRRHETPDQAETTDAFLLDLKKRIEAGESFAALARQYSQSETRLRGGFVGTTLKGQLPRRLEDVAFSLESGAVSAPVRVRGGSVILQVRRKTVGGDLPLATVEERVASRIASERLAARVADIVRGVEAPDGSVVLDRETLMNRIDGAGPETEILRIFDTTLTLGDFRDRNRLGPVSKVAELPVIRRTTIWDSYIRARNNALLGDVLMEQPSPRLKGVAERLALDRAVEEMVDEELRSTSVSAQIGEKELIRFFEGNRDLFRSPVLIDVQVCRVAFGDDPPRQLAGLERRHTELAAGSQDLAEVCESEGGIVENMGWNTIDEIRIRLPKKLEAMLADAGKSGLTVPFHYGDDFVIVRRVGLRPARELSFGEAEGRVREELARSLAGQERLQAASFQFHTQRLLDALPRSGESTSAHR